MKTKTKQKALTKLALSKRLEISRTTLNRYLGLPGAPGRGRGGYDLAAVADFIATQSHSEITQAKTNSEIARLKAREIALRCERLKLALDVEMGKYVKLDELIAETSKVMSGI